MTAENDNGAFQRALSAYEGLMAGSARAENQSAAHKDAVAFVEKVYPNFGAEFRNYEDAQRNVVENIKVGHLIRTEGGLADWYPGPKTFRGEWPSYLQHLRSNNFNEKAISSIDDATSRIMFNCANPKSPGDKRKGLVIGHVQSGKTANYTGLIAKAVDAGYRIIIVLAGMHTNLRVQTQIRLLKDLSITDVKNNRRLSWIPLTDSYSDIGPSFSPGFTSNSSNIAIMVVKKHERRLENVAKFLRSIPEDTLHSRGVLIIDDESDQATPNTLAAKSLVSTINSRVKDIWSAVLTGTYVAYTATPFANVFINPKDAGDLYPDDFTMALDKPDGYLGADDFFDVTQDANSPDDEPIYQLVHEVPDPESAVLVPRSRDIDSFSPFVTRTLGNAIKWFVLATAIRELRNGKSSHSSMLVHSSHLIAAHRKTRDAIVDFVNDLALTAGEQEAEFRSIYEQQIAQAATLAEKHNHLDWPRIWNTAREILSRVTVKIDNGDSKDRLVYRDDKVETVIAVGGSTLSRGLTLEGLVVSYFLRTSNTYDTLLQMGRWFGFRPGYEDLVRIWAGPGLLEDYRHLAHVESQLRQEIFDMEEENKSPREFALKVQSHPGRLEITSPNKMGAAQLARAGLGGKRRQTIYLDRSPKGIRRGQNAAFELVQHASRVTATPLYRATRTQKGQPSVLFPGLSNADLLRFLQEYWVCSAEPWLQPAAMRDWLERHGGEASWNLVLASGRTPKANAFQFAPGVTVNLSSRPPMAKDYWKPNRLKQPVPDFSDVVNIRALMPGEDYLLDLKILSDNGRLDTHAAKELAEISGDQIGPMKRLRSRVAPKAGSVVLYAIDPESRPQRNSKVRTQMNASEPMIGLGVVFPTAKDEDPGEYWAVPIEDSTIAEPPEESFITDDESDFTGRTNL